MDVGVESIGLSGPSKCPKVMAQDDKTESTGSIGSVILGLYCRAILKLTWGSFYGGLGLL